MYKTQMIEHAIEYVIFDAMGVVYPVGDDTKDLLIPFVQARNPLITSKEINLLYHEASLGHIQSTDFWSRCNISGISPEDLEYTYLSTYLKPDEAFFPVAKTLKERGLHLVMLSNDVSEWSLFLRRKWGLDDIFDLSIISGDVGIRKPDAGIYRFALEKLKCNPEECMFIDDRVKNLIPAKELGIQVIHFDRENTLESSVQGIQRVICFEDLLGIPY